MRVALQENDGNNENDANDEDNSDSYKQGVETTEMTKNHWNLGCKPRLPRNNGFRNTRTLQKVAKLSQPKWQPRAGPATRCSTQILSDLFLRFFGYRAKIALHPPLGVGGGVAAPLPQRPGVSHVKLPRRCHATSRCGSYTVACRATLCHSDRSAFGTPSPRGPVLDPTPFPQGLAPAGAIHHEMANLIIGDPG